MADMKDIEEKVEQLILKYWDFSLIRPEPLNNIRKGIQQLAITLIEEEREACAKIAQDHIPGLLEHNQVDDGGAYKSATATSIRDKIRAHKKIK